MPMRLRPPRLHLKQRLLAGYLLLFGFAAAGFLILGLFAGRFERLPTIALWLSVGAATALFVAGLWLALAMARSISAPLQRIAKATRSLATGRFDVRVGPSSIPEANSLAIGFNEMAEALGNYNSANIDRLIAEQHRNTAVLSSIDEGLIIFDERARIERINPVACRQLGANSEDAVGRNLDELLGMANLDLAVREAVNSGKDMLTRVPDLEIGAERARRVLAINLSPFHDLARSGVVMVLRDVTMERNLDRLRSEFIMRASHELRTPISTLSLAVGLLAERIDWPEGTREAELLRTASDETRRLVDLVNDLLDVSRLTSDGLPLHVEPCAIGALFEAARQRFATVVAEKSMTIEIAVAIDVPLMNLDPLLFSRLLDNLIANAIRHTNPEGTIKLSASASSAGIAIVVSDSGEGIAPAQLDRIFDPFVQVGGNVGGAGLGLTLCREIVERHDGRIAVASEPGQGAQFKIKLPWSRVAG
ncbi:MAG: ATP-binding protein [Dokdonella sp.]